MKICLMGNTFEPVRKRDLVTGYSVAAADLVKSFFEYSEAEMITCLYEPWKFPEKLLREMMEKDGREAGRIRMISEYDLLFHGVKVLPEINILHSVKEDSVPLLSIRENLKADIPVTFTLHGIAEQHLIMDFFYPMLLLPFKPYDAVICTSEAVRKTLEQMFCRMEDMVNRTLIPPKPVKRQIRLEKVPLGVDISYFRPLDKKECRKKLGFAEDEVILLWFGRFSGIYKADLYPLLQVFRKLLVRNKEKALKLVLAGSQDPGEDYAGKVYSEAQHMGIERYVKVLFHHEIEDRAVLYSACDIFTSPADNIQETFGLTPIEAMACGVPQVVSDWDGYRDTVADNETGFLIKTMWTDCMDDIARMDRLPSDGSHRRMLQHYLQVRSTAVDGTEYFDHLQTLVSNPGMRRAFSEASRKRAEKYFSLQNTVAQTEAVWKDLHESAKFFKGDFRNMNIPMINYSVDFQWYPTQMLEESMEFEATEYGAVTPVKDLAQYSMFNRTIEEAALPEKIMKFILEKKYASMQEAIAQFSEFEKAQIKREWMYLYKYDMIRLRFKDQKEILEKTMR